MNRNKALRWAIAVLCVGAAAWAAAAVIGLWLEGAPLRAEDPFYAVFTRQRLAGRLAPAAILALAALVLAVTGRRFKAEEPAQIRETRREPVGAAWQRPGRGTVIARAALLLLAAALIAAGVWNGGLRDALQKATMICTECIGLG